MALHHDSLLGARDLQIGAHRLRILELLLRSLSRSHFLHRPARIAPDVLIKQGLIDLRIMRILSLVLLVSQVRLHSIVRLAGDHLLTLQLIAPLSRLILLVSLGHPSALL